MSDFTAAARSVCPFDCPDTCSLHVKLTAGRIVSVDGDPGHPVTRGAICNKVRHLDERVYHPDRLTTPMRRTGPKGAMAFEPIGWDEAYAELTDKLRRTVAEYGAQAILPYSFYGNMGILNSEGMDRRFFHRLGASRLDRTICNAAGAAGYGYTMGAGAGIDPEDTVHSRFVFVWGCNIVSTNMHQAIYLQEARKRGARVVHIDVHRNRTSQLADEFVPIVPGTDTALALGMMHVLIRDKLTNDDFIARYTKGFAELAAEAALYTPERTARLTGVPAETVEALARAYGEASPSFIRIGNGLQHHDNGGMAVRTIACLPALTGQWGLRGGGALKGNGAYASFNSFRLERPDLLPDPGVRTINMNRLGEALLDDGDPVRLLFVYNCNPAIVAPDQNRVRAGLAREDLYTVVHELFLTDTCLYADLMLPATSHFENEDLFGSYWHLYVQHHQPVIPPVGMCKSNFTLFKELGLRMGFEPELFDIDEAQMIRDALTDAGPYLEGITYERLKAEGWMKLSVPRGSMFPGRIPTPSGRIELYSEAMLAAGLSPVPAYAPLLEPEDLPFLFVSGPNHSYLNSTFANQDRMKRLEKSPRVDMNPVDAAVRGLRTGDTVRLRNARGECRIGLRVTDAVLPGVLVTQGLWWEHGNKGAQAVNALTSQRLSDMGGGATFFSTRVDVEKV